MIDQIQYRLIHPTHLSALLVQAIIFAGLFLLLAGVFKASGIPKNLRLNLLLTLFALFFSLMVAEVIVRAGRMKETYTEIRHKEFISYRSYHPDDLFHTHPPNTSYDLRNNVGVSYPRTINSIGFSDVEWAVEKPDSVVRIIGLGDSFTEGDGAPKDSTWVQLLENRLETTHPARVELFNAGICGSDPFFNLKAAETLLLPYHPDAILQTISTQDFQEDIRLRGGYERFGADGKVHYLPAPWWETIYAHSHLFRLLMENGLGYSQLLAKNPDRQESENLFRPYVQEIVQEYAGFSRKTGIEVVLILYPHQEALVWGYNFPLDTLLLEAVTSASGLVLLDLKSCYEDKIQESGLPFSAIWWQGDGHHRSAGYDMMAECIFERLDWSTILPAPEMTGE